MMCFSGMAQAQQTAIKMVADGHYFGARQQLERYIDNAEPNDKYLNEAEALTLVCDYVLQNPGTADRMEAWIDENPASPYVVPLSSMQRILLLKEGRIDEALACFFSAEMNGECLNCETVYAYPLGKFSEETLSYNKVLYRLAGERFYDMEEYDQAIRYLENGEETRNSLYKLGMCYFIMSQHDKAASCLSKSADTNRDGLAQNAWLHAGLSYLKTGDKKSASRAFMQASEITGDASVREEALYNYALTLHEGGTMGFGESVDVFERFLNDYPNSQYANNVAGYLSEVYFTTKNYSSALKSINKIKRPNNEILTAKQRVLYNLGIQEFTLANYDKALNYVNQSIALGKKDAEAHAESYYLKGESEYRLGNYSAAANDLEKALSLGKSTPSGDLKNSAYATYSLAYTQFKQKNYSAALTNFQKYVSSQLATIVSQPNNAQVKSFVSDAHNRIGDCYLDKRSYDKAYESYQKALEVDGLRGDYALLQQAYIMGLKGDYDAKVALIDKMTTEYAGSQYASDALFEQGRAYVQSGKAENATTVFQALIQQYPQSANARKACNEIAMLLAESGNVDEAVGAYKQVINDYPNTEEAQTALSNLKDIFTSQGKVNEYMELAGRMGKTFSAEELDDMIHDAAVKAMTNGDYVQALQYYTQLQAQTASDDYRLEAQTGILRSAYANGGVDTTIEAATAILDDANKLSPEIKAEARMCRAESYFKKSDAQNAVADLQILAQDAQTVYGAQANVRLAQYAYDTKQYQSAETVLSNFIDSGTAYTYWLARAFVLLSDVYKAQGRDVEARQTLLALKSNYSENEEINTMIEERLK